MAIQSRMRGSPADRILVSARLVMLGRNERLGNDSHRNSELGAAGHVLREAAVPASRGGSDIAYRQCVRCLIDEDTASIIQLREERERESVCM